MWITINYFLLIHIHQLVSTLYIITNIGGNFVLQAKFLKACGTLLQTPVEIRKASGRSADTLTQKERLPNFSSPGASIEKLKMEKQSEESPAPVKICEEWVTRSGSLMDSSSRYISQMLHVVLKQWRTGSSK